MIDISHISSSIGKAQLWSQQKTHRPAPTTKQSSSAMHVPWKLLVFEQMEALVLLSFKHSNNTVCGVISKTRKLSNKMHKQVSQGTWRDMNEETWQKRIRLMVSILQTSMDPLKYLKTTKQCMV